MHTEESGRQFQDANETELTAAYETTEVFQSGRGDFAAWDSFCATAWMVDVLGRHGVVEGVILTAVWEIGRLSKYGKPFRDAAKILNKLAPAQT